jgi:hypothetical protein
MDQKGGDREIMIWSRIRKGREEEGGRLGWEGGEVV